MVAWQMPPLNASLGLLMISLGIVMGFNIRFNSDISSEE